MSLIPESAISEITRELHAAVYDLYEKRGPLLEDDLHDVAPFFVTRMMPILEELARTGAYRSREKA